MKNADQSKATATPKPPPIVFHARRASSTTSPLILDRRTSTTTPSPLIGLVDQTDAEVASITRPSITHIPLARRTVSPKISESPKMPSPRIAIRKTTPPLTTSIILGTEPFVVGSLAAPKPPELLDSSDQIVDNGLSTKPPKQFIAKSP